MGAQLASLDVENLSGAVATSGDIATISAEAYAANNTLVHESVDKVDVQNTADAGVEDGKPVLPFPLEPLVNVIRVKFSKSVSNVRRSRGERVGRLMQLTGWRSGARDLGRSGVRGRGVLLGSRGSRRSTSARPGLSGARRGGGLGCLWAIAYDIMSEKNLEASAYWLGNKSSPNPRKQLLAVSKAERYISNGVLTAIRVWIRRDLPTVDTSRARLVPTEGVLRGSRWRIEAWRTLRRAVGKALGLLRFLWRRGQTGATLSCSSCHYAAKQGALTVADCRRRLRGATMLRTADVGRVGRPSGSVKLSLQTRELFLVPKTED